MATNGSGIAATAECKIVHSDGTVLRVDQRVFEAYRDFIEQRKQGSIEINFISGGVRSVISKTVH